MSKQGSGVRGQGSGGAVGKTCKNCGHWGVDLEDREENPGYPGYCECLLSHNCDHLVASYDFCDFWKDCEPTGETPVPPKV